jgi:hypothetical protein
MHFVLYPCSCLKRVLFPILRDADVKLVVITVVPICLVAALSVLVFAAVAFRNRLDMNDDDSQVRGRGWLALIPTLFWAALAWSNSASRRLVPYSVAGGSSGATSSCD